MNVSKSPISGKTYSIPKDCDDKVGISSFLSQHNNKPIVVIQGLGFVGTVMSLVCAASDKKEYAVIGVDRPAENTLWRIHSLNEGIFPLIAEDPKIEKLFQKSQKQNNFYATYDPYAYSVADTIIVDINLDFTKTNDDSAPGYVDLTHFKNAIKAIGQHCKKDVLILVETTVPPGTCQKVVKPIIKECLQERRLPIDEFSLGHSYERVMPGPEYVDSIQNYPRVYSGINEKSADKTEQFLHTIINTEQYPLTRLNNTNATEMAKVLENSYRAMNIAFMVEWSRFAEEAGVNMYDIVNAIRQRPTHANLMYPGIGVGGYCLTKDPLLASWSKQNLFNSDAPLTMSERSVATNDIMPSYAFDFLMREYNLPIENKNALLLGISYRSEVGDTRSTPVELFYDHLKKNNTIVNLHDPYVSHWEERQCDIEQDLNQALSEKIDIIIITTGHKIYKQDSTIDHLLTKDDLFILDTIGILSNEQIQKLKQRHTVKVLGRGDL